MRNANTLLLALLLSLPLAACGGDDKGGGDTPTLVFSAIPSEKDKTGYVAKFAKVADYLSKELGVPVRYQHSAKYSDSVEAFVTGDVQLAWFGGLTGVQARHRVEGAKAIAQGAEDPKYFSYFIANHEAGIEPSDEFPAAIKGRSFTFGSKSSTSGRLMPEHFIRTLGASAPADYFGKIAFSGSHNTTALQVQDGQVEVGALSYKTYDKMVAAGEIDPAKAVVIWKTPYYADYNFTVRPDVDATFGEGFTAKLTKALLGMEGDELLDVPFQRSKMIPAKNADFQAIHDLAKQLDLLGEG